MPPRDLTSTLALDPIEAITRRRLLTALPILGLMAAGVSCSDDDDTESPSETWTYESEFGPVELPHTIERIVSVDFYSPAALVDIGVTPVGVVNSYFTDVDGESIPSKYRQPVVEGGARSIGEYWEPDIEAVVAADPDLIIATNDFLPLDSPVREQMEQIAPVVTFTARRAGSWFMWSNEIATILGREDELERLQSEYEQYRDEVRERHADLLDSATFAIFGLSDDQWCVYAQDHFTVAVLDDLGAHFIDEDVPELGLDEDGYPTWLPYEQLRLLNGANVILRFPNTDAAFATLQDNPLWNTLPAVQQGRVFTYINLSVTGSYGWAVQNLRDVDALLAEVKAHLDAE